MTDTDLGFPEEREGAWLVNRYFPSKVGGVPAWLELEALPSKEQLQCGKCKNAKTFLCQIYAPFDDDHNFHRSIYVFVCRTETCQQSNSTSNLTALRSQLARKNGFYSLQPPAEDGNPLPSIPSKRKICLACGCLGPLSCSRCKKANYCSAQHQRAHWPHHKKICSQVNSDNHEIAVEEAVALPEIRFPEWEIVMEPNEDESASVTDAKLDEDDDDGGSDDEVGEEKRLAEFAKLASQGKTGELSQVPDSELDKYTQSAEAVDDKHFRCFKKEVGKDPEQILRYKRNGQPLWIADVQQTVADQLQIPACEHCGSERQFEFQIMPQMLLLLKDQHLDWGVLAVYTCAASCQPAAEVGYLTEYVVKQDILSDEK